MTRLAHGFSLLFAFVMTVGCGKQLSATECDELLEHYTEKQIEQARPSTSGRERVELLRAVRVKSRLDPEFQNCSQRVSRSQFECAMAAHNADQVERCLL